MPELETHTSSPGEAFDTFTCFSRLPCELRWKIWEDAALDNHENRPPGVNFVDLETVSHRAPQKLCRAKLKPRTPTADVKKKWGPWHKETSPYHELNERFMRVGSTCREAKGVIAKVVNNRATIKAKTAHGYVPIVLDQADNALFFCMLRRADGFRNEGTEEVEESTVTTTLQHDLHCEGFANVTRVAVRGDIIMRFRNNLVLSLVGLYCPKLKTFYIIMEKKNLWPTHDRHEFENTGENQGKTAQGRPSPTCNPTETQYMAGSQACICQACH